MATMVGVILPLLFAQPLQGDSLTLNIDAHEANYGLVHVRETFPAKSGKFTLSFPHWIPGHHSPSGPINHLINMRFMAGAQTLTWRRDDVDMFHITVDVPDGVNQIQAEFDSASPQGRSFTPNFARLDWNEDLLYPTGQKSDDIRITASVTVPSGWKMATPLIKDPSTADRVEFPTVSLTEFIDSPAIVGQYFNRIPVGPNEEIDAFADKPDALNLSLDGVEKCKRLINEAYAAFGTKHYRSYKFLVTLSDKGGFAGLEHHECSEDGSGLSSFQTPDGIRDFAELICHEYTHSWNGKYRRPASLSTPDYDAPMKGEGLWVYEGLTQYLGELFAARSGFVDPDRFREDLAGTLAAMSYRAGRNWRPLEDTAIAAQIVRNPDAWQTSVRAQDYYTEAVPIWLEVDSIIRQQTKGQRSLDDFTRLFHGGNTGYPELKTYTFDDVVQGLNTVTPYDWAGLLTSRVKMLQPQLSLAGIENDGWKLVYTDKPREAQRRYRRDNAGGDNDAWYTIGVQLDKDGVVQDVILTMPGAQAGLRPGVKLVGVGSLAFSDENLKAALASKSEFDMLTEYGGVQKTMHIAYKEGLKYPHLERDPNKPDVLSDVIKSAVRPSG